MNKWQDYYKIEEIFYQDGDLGSMFVYNVVIISTCEVVGKYKDEHYARKQAKYKFKKIANKVEKMLLG